MASQRVSRYIAVQRAKGLDPDPQQLARMIRDDTRSRIASRAVPVPQRAVEPDLVSAPSDVTSLSPEAEQRLGSVRKAVRGDGNSVYGFGDAVPVTTPNLRASISNEMLSPELKKLGAKGVAGGVVSALSTPTSVMSPASAALQGTLSAMTGPMTLAFLLNKVVGSSITGSVIGENIEQMFGESAAQEAADVMMGKAELSSISPQGQNAYANAMVAAGQNPSSLTGIAWEGIKGLVGKGEPPTPITSTVTPYHTPEAISEGFGTAPPERRPGEGFPFSSGTRTYTPGVDEFGGVAGNPNMVSTGYMLGVSPSDYRDSDGGGGYGGSRGSRGSRGGFGDVSKGGHGGMGGI